MREIIAHYGQVREEERLASGWGALELARTQEIMLRHLPAPPAKVLDVGGAAGVYSEWLGRRGYTAHLVDPVPRHLEEARRAGRHIASVAMGDARTLAWPNGAFDIVLLMGPLYHLTGREERVAALREAGRVLRGGGLLFASAISRFAPLLEALVTGILDDPGFAPILAQDLRDGQHRNATGNPLFFTTAFLHRPEELRAEVLEAGFRLIEVAGIEGPGWIAPDFASRWRDPARRESLLSAARAVEHEEALMGMSQHLCAVAAKG